MDMCQDIFETLANISSFQYLTLPSHPPFNQSCKQLQPVYHCLREILEQKEKKKIVLSLFLCSITETFTVYIRDLRPNTMKTGKASFSHVPYS